MCTFLTVTKKRTFLYQMSLVTIHQLSPQAEFLLGKSYYSDDSFGLAAEHFEVAIDEYFIADKECRVLCEGAYNYDGYNYMEYSADLFQTMTG